MILRLPTPLLNWFSFRTNILGVIRAPDLVIGDPPYTQRWYVIPRNRFFNVYYHRILRSDEDRALHDHPWLFNASILLEGAYFEVTPADRYDPAGSVKRRRHWAGDILFRWGGAYAHRLELIDGRPCRTLFVTGPKVREWGFWCPKGWRHWKDFTACGATGDSRIVGPGCGET